MRHQGQSIRARCQGFGRAKEIIYRAPCRSARATATSQPSPRTFRSTKQLSPGFHSPSKSTTAAAIRRDGRDSTNPPTRATGARIGKADKRSLRNRLRVVSRPRSRAEFGFHNHCYHCRAIDRRRSGQRRGAHTERIRACTRTATGAGCKDGSCSLYCSRATQENQEPERRRAGVGPQDAQDDRRCFREGGQGEGRPVDGFDTANRRKGSGAQCEWPHAGEECNFELAGAERYGQADQARVAPAVEGVEGHGWSHGLGAVACCGSRQQILCKWRCRPDECVFTRSCVVCLLTSYSQALGSRQRSAKAYTNWTYQRGARTGDFATPSVPVLLR